MSATSDEFERPVKTASVTTTDGLVSFKFRKDGVLVKLACDEALISWSDWLFIARVFGKDRR